MARRTGSRKNRHIRNLQQQKGTGITTQARPPLSGQGNDGDQMVVGQKLYIKVNGRWMPFQSGGGNINDGWHGSQKYVKILPKDFIPDNELAGTQYPLTYGDSNDPEEDYESQKGYVAVNSYLGSLGVHALGADETENKGVGCSVPIPLGYWAIACKIYCSHIIEASAAVTRTDATSETGTHSAYAGVMIFNASLETGSAETLLSTRGKTQERIVFDTAMLGKNSNYCWITINDLPGDSLIYGGYIEIGRVQTAEALAEEAGGGGDVLMRGG